MEARRVLVPLPDRDFDVTEVAVPWRVLTRAGHRVVFATERGATPAADPLLLRGVIFGALGAEAEPKAFYRELENAPEFTRPIAWRDVDVGDYDGLLLPGGHAPGMKQYLASPELQKIVAAYWATGRPVGAICHGVLVLARARDAVTGKSVLAGARTTCLPRYMEAAAYGLTFWKLGRYYRTYRAYVEDEVRDALDDPDRQFVRGPLTLGPLSVDGRRVRLDGGDPFVVEDGAYVSARWPGDAYAFAQKILERIEARAPAAKGAAAARR